MSQHDKHQYYFEKYLRNEMPLAERDAFDAKLAEDASLRMAFEYYQLNRSKLLSELIQEHRMLRRDNRLNKLIFLLISLTGIALAFNYFVYRQAGTPTNGKRNDNIFVRYIPFLNRETKPEVKPTPHTAVVRPNIKTQPQAEVVARLEPSTNRDERLSSDSYQRDTFVTLIDKAGAEMLMAMLNRTDSTEADSIQPRSILKASKLPIVLVEYWESPLGYKGYLLQKNTLVLYGIQQRQIILYRDQDQLHAYIPGLGDLVIVEQPNFISF